MHSETMRTLTRVVGATKTKLKRPPQSSSSSTSQTSPLLSSAPSSSTVWCCGRCYHKSCAGLGTCRVVGAREISKTTTVRRQRRAFHGSVSSLARSDDLSRRNHYERLQISPKASPNDIKKSFYRLSKAHHPDANRNDPSAATTFALLSESYALLSSPARRAIYDRDVMILAPSHHPTSPNPSSSSSPSSRRGSYHSSSSSSSAAAAGGRPASGLSRRRSAFRGPPPSFYRAGGWGAHAEARRRAHEESTAHQDAGAASKRRHRGQDDGCGSRAWGDGGMHAGGGVGGGGGGVFRDGEVPHFDRDAHRRTQENEDRRRAARRSKSQRGTATSSSSSTARGQQQVPLRDRGRDVSDDEEKDSDFELQNSLAAHFAIIVSILAVTFVVPVVHLNFLHGNNRDNGK